MMIHVDRFYICRAPYLVMWYLRLLSCILISQPEIDGHRGEKMIINYSDRNNLVNSA